MKSRPSEFAVRKTRNGFRGAISRRSDFPPGMRRLLPAWPLVLLLAATSIACRQQGTATSAVPDRFLTGSGATAPPHPAEAGASSSPTTTRGATASEPPAAVWQPPAPVRADGNSVDRANGPIVQTAYEYAAEFHQDDVEPLPPVPPADESGSQPALRDGLGALMVEDFEMLALQNNPTLRMAGAEIEKEVGNYTQVGLYPNPTVGYLRSDPSKAGQSRTDGGFIQQQIIMGRKLRINREIETFGIQNVTWQQRAQRERVLNDVRIRFYQALGAQDRVRLARQMVDIAEKGAEAVRKLEMAEEASQRDVLQAEIQLGLFQSALENAQGHFHAAWEQLTDMAGVPGFQQQALQGDLADSPLPDVDPEAVWARLVSSNAQLQSIRAQVGIARMTLKRQRVQAIPDVTVQVVGERDHTNDYSTVSTLLAMPVPVFNRYQGAVYNAYYDLARAENEVQRTILVLRDLFSSSLRDYANSRSDVLRLRQEILPRARKNLELTTKGYDAGELQLLDLLNARKSYFDINLAYIDASTQLQKAAVELEGLQLTGGLNPATIGAAIQAGGEAAERRRAVQGLLQQQQRAALQLYNPGTTK